jgi:hypothetical protein
MIEFLQEVPIRYWGVLIFVIVSVLGARWLKKIDPPKPSKEVEDKRSQERFSQMIETEEEDPLPTTVEDDNSENRNE